MKKIAEEFKRELNQTSTYDNHKLGPLVVHTCPRNSTGRHIKGNIAILGPGF